MQRRPRRISSQIGDLSQIMSRPAGRQRLLRDMDRQAVLPLINPRTFTWTAKAADILKKVTRAKAALDKIPTA